MIKNWFLSKSIRFKYLISYLVIAIFSITILSAVYAYLYTNVRGHVHSSNEMLLESVRKDVDSLFQSMNNLYRRVSMNQKLTSLNEMEPGSVDYRYQMYEIRQDLMIAGDNYNNLDYYIYVRNGDYIIDSGLAMEREKYYEGIIGNKLNYDSAISWSNDFFGSGGNKVLKNEINNADGSLGTLMSFVYPIPFSRTELPHTYLVISVKEDVFMGVYGKNFNMERFDVFVRTRGGKYLIATGDMEGIEEVASKASSGIITSYGGKSTVMSVLSQNEDYIYLVRSDNGAFFTELSPIVGFILISFAIYIILVFILIRFLLRVAYNPIKELMVLSGNPIPKKAKQNRDEFSIIKNTLLSTSEKLIKTESELKLKAFLTGEASLSRIGELFPNEPDPLACQYFVVLFKAGDLAGLFSEEIIEDSQKVEKASFIIGNVLDELLANEFEFVRMIKIDAYLVAVIISGGMDYGNSFELAINYAKQFINENFSFNFFTAVSSLYGDACDLNKAYSEVVSALEHSLLLGKEKIIYYDSLRKENISRDAGYHFSADFEAELYKALVDRNLAYAKELIEQFFGMNFSSDHTDVNILRLALCDLMATLLKSVRDDRTYYSTALEQVKSCMKKLVENNVNMEAFKETVLGITEEICGSGKFHGVKHISDIIGIIEREYSNRDLTNDFIADRLSVSEEYVSRLFKKHMDVNLREYIQIKRVEKAKELLLKFDMTNEEIASRVGFGGTRYLFKLFKKYVGDTPAQYRIKARNKSE